MKQIMIQISKQLFLEQKGKSFNGDTQSITVDASNRYFIFGVDIETKYESDSLYCQSICNDSFFNQLLVGC